MSVYVPPPLPLFIDKSEAMFYVSKKLNFENIAFDFGLEMNIA